MNRKQIARTMRKTENSKRLQVAINIGYVRNPRDGYIAHFGVWARHGRIITMQSDCEKWIIDKYCDGCFISLYNMPIKRLASLITAYSHTHG